MLFSGPSYPRPAPTVAPPHDGSDREHSTVLVLLSLALFSSILLLYHFFGIIWSAVIAGSAAALALCYVKARRLAAPLPPDADGGDSGLDPAAVAALPTFVYKREVPAGDDDGAVGPGWAQCVICLGLVQVGEVVRRLPSCGHMFHVDCIGMWLRAHSTCPVCRRAAAVVDEIGQPRPPV